MEILKQVYYYLDYTLQFVMWLVIAGLRPDGHSESNNIILNMFIRFTDRCTSW